MNDTDRAPYGVSTVSARGICASAGSRGGPAHPPCRRTRSAELRLEPAQRRAVVIAEGDGRETLFEPVDRFVAVRAAVHEVANAEVAAIGIRCECSYAW